MDLMNRLHIYPNPVASFMSSFREELFSETESPVYGLLGDSRVRAYSSKLTPLNTTGRFVNEGRETFTSVYVSYILGSVEWQFSGKQNDEELEIAPVAGVYYVSRGPGPFVASDGRGRRPQGPVRG